MSLQLASEPLFVAYLVVFGVTALVCFVSVRRAQRIDDPDTRRGLIGLLLTSGGWATAQLLFLAVPAPELKTVFYVIGLVIGFSTVGAWLYFCSAYTGRSLHRHALIRWAAIIVFITVVTLKVTNPIHNLYFTTDVATTPVFYLTINNNIIHWLVAGLSYALTAVGYFMLLELFVQVSYDTRPFVILMAITGLPIGFNLIGHASPYLLDITYEPIGVALFAIGVFYIYVDRFQAIQLAKERDDPVIVLSAADRIRDYNDSAVSLFPRLRERDSIGTPVRTILPTIVDALESDTTIIGVEQRGKQRFYRLTENPFGADQSQLGRLLILSDITQREQYRRKLERQNERLDKFANTVSHDLRNPLNVATGRLTLAQQDFDSEHLEAVADAHSRMEDLIKDVLALAQNGQPIEETESIRLSAVADQCWQMVETADAELVIEEDLSFMADTSRLRQLLENLFRNAIEHGGSEITIRVGATESGNGFYVADNGAGIPVAARDDVFDSGYSTTEEGTGLGLVIVKEVVDAHDWTIAISEGGDQGTLFEITWDEGATPEVDK